VRFYKFHGAGNDFIVIDAISDGKTLPTDHIAALCNRQTGIGADGILFACSASSGADAAMRIFNSDGSEAEMTGNGIRCLAKYLYEHAGISKESMLIETRAGTKRLDLTLQNGRVTQIEVEMGPPEYTELPAPTKKKGGPGEISIPMHDAEPIDAVCLSMGNPHCVIFVDDVETVPLSTLGPQVENHEYFMSRTNVEIVQVLSPDHIKLRVWERGVGETAACGTGACAAFAATVRMGRGESPMVATLPGGDLKIRADQFGYIYLTGPAVEVYSGVLSPHWAG
jgi:diaminopimelate epimerase